MHGGSGLGGVTGTGLAHGGGVDGPPDDGGGEGPGPGDVGGGPPPRGGGAPPGAGGVPPGGGVGAPAWDAGLSSWRMTIGNDPTALWYRALIVALPALVAVTIPELETLATDALSDDHAASALTSADDP